MVTTVGRGSTAVLKRTVADKSGGGGDDNIWAAAAGGTVAVLAHYKLAIAW